MLPSLEGEKGALSSRPSGHHPVRAETIPPRRILIRVLTNTHARSTTHICTLKYTFTQTYTHTHLYTQRLIGVYVRFCSQTNGTNGHLSVEPTVDPKIYLLKRNERCTEYEFVYKLTLLYRYTVRCRVINVPRNNVSPNTVVVHQSHNIIIFTLLSVRH